MRNGSAGTTRTSWDDWPASEEAIEREHSPLSETLATMPSWMSRSVLYALVLLLGTGLAFACIARVDEVTLASAVVTPLGRLKPVQSDLEGIVTELLVQEGDVVAAGQPLVAVDSPEVVTILADLRAAEQARKDVQRELKEVLPLKEAQFKAWIDILRKKIDSYARRQQALDEQITNENVALELASQRHQLELEKQDELIRQLELEQENARLASDFAQKELEAVERLTKRGAATDFELLTAQRKRSEAAAAIKKLQSKIETAQNDKQIQDVALRAQVNEHRKALAKIREEMAENTVASQAAELEIRQNQDQLELVRLETQTKLDAAAFRYAQARRKADLNLNGINPELLDLIAKGETPETDRHLVLSPLDGMVGSIGVTDGETAQRGATLMMLIPKDATLIAELRVPNKEIGRVKEGLAARFKFDAFPYAEYGAIDGRLTDLVKVSERQAAKSDTNAQAADASHYRGYCSLNQAYFRVRGQRKPLLPGMTATAEIITGRKRIISILLKPLLEFQQGRKAES